MTHVHGQPHPSAGRPGPVRLSAFMPASAPVPTGAALVVVAGICAVVALGLTCATGTVVYSLIMTPDAPAALWVPAVLIAALAVLIGVTTVRLLGAPARSRRLSWTLTGTTIAIHNGLSDRIRTIDLHGTGIEVATRRDMQRRQRFDTHLPRRLTELRGPNIGGRGMAALLLVDVPDDGARPTDPPPRSLPVNELRFLANVLAASPHPEGRHAAAVIAAMTG